MALINCPECGGKVSDKATACIHCGYPLQKNKKIREQNLIEEILTDSRWKNENGWFSFSNGNIVGCVTRCDKKIRFSGTAEYREELKCIVLSGKGIEGDQIDMDKNGKRLCPLASFSDCDDFYRDTGEDEDEEDD